MTSRDGAGAPLSVGVLSCPDAPLAGRVVGKLLDLDVPVKAIIVDQKPFGAKNARIHQERTGGRLPAVPLSTYAARLPCFDVPDHNAPETLALIEDLELGLLVNAESPRILKEPLLQATPIGAINCHPGWLPDFRGSCCVEWAIFEDGPVANTVHVMTDGIDEGPVVRRQIVPVHDGDSYVDVRVRVFEYGIDLLASVGADLSHGRLGVGSFEPQSDGRYYGPIDDAKLGEVVAKLQEGRYRATPSDLG